MLEYIYSTCQPEVRSQIIEMTLNASGIRDTARVLKISPTTVIKVLKDKEDELESVNRNLLESVKNPDKLHVVISRCEEAELDEMWSFVHDKGNQRWLWHAIDHKTGKVLAYVFGRRKNVVFKKLKALLEPFGIRHYYTDDWAAYSRYLDEAKHHIGKRNTQKIERKHLTLRTRIKRLARKTICFSKLEKMHDIVIGLFINRYEFGLPV
jgi:IS1 family transposase